MKKINKIDFKWAFLLKNFRNLSFEWKIVFLASLATVIACVLPWVALTGEYLTMDYYSAFGGETRIIGVLIFFLSLANVYYFIDKIFDLKKFDQLRKRWDGFSENYFFAISAGEQILLLMIAWSIIKRISVNYDIAFGFFIAFFAQIILLAAAMLAIKDKKHQKAKSFFSLPEVENLKQKHKIETTGDNISTNNER